MRKNVAIAAALAFAGSARPVLASGDPSQAVAYACLANPKTVPVKVVLTPPPAGFKCPPGQKLFVVTRQMQEKASAPFAEVEEPEPTPPPGIPVPPKKKQPKKTQPKNPIPPGGKVCTPDGFGGLYCCTSLSSCQLE